VPTKGFPHRTIPTGWFQVGWSDELGEAGGGLIKNMRYFGQDLVMFRGVSGQVVVLDAYCAHMGANLGIGGTVCGNNIQCPFHGWRWGPDGRNTDIPYSERTSPRRLRSWHVQEVAGLIMVWHHPEGAEPSWQPPEIPEASDPDYLRISPHCYHRWADLKMPAQLVGENAVDGVHFKYVHGNSDIGTTLKFAADGEIFTAVSQLTFGGGRKSTWLTPNGPVVGQQQFTLHGLGLILTRFPDTDRALEIDCATPIDADSSDRRLTMYARRAAGQSDEMPVGPALKRFQSAVKLAAMDFPIWENMHYLTRPLLTKEEAAPQLAMRRWAEQFYVDQAARRQARSASRQTQAAQ
jgi:3-ketosteroid 9alpha-monooxygenase subunit A